MATFAMRRDEYDGDIISEAPSSNLDTMRNTGSAKTNSNSQSLSSNDPLQHPNFQTLPPQASNNAVVFPNENRFEHNCLMCCCMHARDEVPAGSNRLDQAQTNRRCCVEVSRQLRVFLSNSCVYLYVISMTFIVVLLLLAELLIDVGIIIVPDVRESINTDVTTVLIPSTASENSNRNRIVEILHWINFSILALFFLEVLLRLYAWKIRLVQSVPAVVDSAVVAVALVGNIATTAAAGYNSPFNAISLIIIFRFVRVYSIIQCYVVRVKDDFRLNLAQVESNCADLRLTNQRLKRQVSEKDYEIKQLRAHLGKLDSKSQEGLVTDLAKRDVSRDQYDSELQRAIALSKKAYDEENGGAGYVNAAYSNEDKVKEFVMPYITVHHRENSIRRDNNDKASTSNDTATLEAAAEQTENVDTSNQNGSCNRITHEELHSSAETDSQNVATDTALLLTDKEVKPGNNDNWTVGYCLMQSPEGVRMPLNDIKLHTSDGLLLTKSGDLFKNAASDVGAVDEGVGRELSTPQQKPFRKKHKRTQSGMSSNADTLSDPGCVSTSSFYSESGYQSDDLPYSAASSPKSLSKRSSSKQKHSSISKVLPNSVSSSPSKSSTSSPSKSSLTSPSDVDMVIIQEDNIEGVAEDAMEEDEF